MGLVQRFDPPGHLPDFHRIPGQLEQWHQAVSCWFDEARDVQKNRVPDGRVQFFNPTTFDPGGPVLEQDITWNAFPKELLRLYGRERALREAEMLWPLTRYAPRFTGDIAKRTLYRPLNEYCEWHVVRDPNTSKIKKVVFTSEPPEYWQAMFGDTLKTNEGRELKFEGNRDLVLKLYRELVSDEVELEDLVASEDIVSEDPDEEPLVREGCYNPYNKWNTTHGIVHLCSPPNTLEAEITLAADASVIRKDRRTGRTLVEADALICCTGYGGPNRNSDPTIGGEVNALARLGAYVTLRNPVGLYMDYIDLIGWAAPDGRSVAECVRITRGTPGLIERLEVEVPPEWGFTVSDLTIGGVEIRNAAQIAECITVKLTGVAASLGALKDPKPALCSERCWIDPHNATNLLRAIPYDNPGPPGTRPALVDQGGGELLATNGATPPEVADEPMRRRKRRSP
jgi:hypothetical protein